MSFTTSYECELGQVPSVLSSIQWDQWCPQLNIAWRVRGKMAHAEICGLLCCSGKFLTQLALHPTCHHLGWPLLAIFLLFFLSHRIQVPLLIALFSALRSLFLWFLVYFLFPTQAICPMRAKNNFVLITVDSEMPRTFSVRLREGDQEVFVKWSLTGQKCFA